MHRLRDEPLEGVPIPREEEPEELLEILPEILWEVREVQSLERTIKAQTTKTT
jgi:hypothetical protein